MQFQLIWHQYFGKSQDKTRKGGKEPNPSQIPTALTYRKFTSPFLLSTGIKKVTALGWSGTKNQELFLLMVSLRTTWLKAPWRGKCSPSCSFCSPRGWRFQKLQLHRAQSSSDWRPQGGRGLPVLGSDTRCGLMARTYSSWGLLSPCPHWSAPGCTPHLWVVPSWPHTSTSQGGFSKGCNVFPDWYLKTFAISHK